MSTLGEKLPSQQWESLPQAIEAPRILEGKPIALATERAAENNIRPGMWNMRQCNQQPLDEARRLELPGFPEVCCAEN